MIAWEQNAELKFKQMLVKIPVFLQGIAREKISNKAESLARSDNRDMIVEKDLVDACFAETPFGFHGPMKCDMEEIGIDYKKYGYER